MFSLKTRCTDLHYFFFPRQWTSTTMETLSLIIVAPLTPVSIFNQSFLPFIALFPYIFSHSLIVIIPSGSLFDWSVQLSSFSSFLSCFVSSLFFCFAGISITRNHLDPCRLRVEPLITIFREVLKTALL